MGKRLGGAVFARSSGTGPPAPHHRHEVVHPAQTELLALLHEASMGRRSSRWSRVQGFEPVVLDLGNPAEAAPVAIRLSTTTGGVVWIIAAPPWGEEQTREDLKPDHVLLRHDEIIVLFDDAEAHRIELGPQGGAHKT